MGPKVAVQIHFEEADVARGEIDAELESAIVKGLEHADQRLRHRRDLVAKPRIIKGDEAVFVGPVGKVALFGISSQMCWVCLFKEHHWHDGLAAADGNHGDLDIAAFKKRLNDRIMPVAVNCIDCSQDISVINRITHAPGRRGCIGLYDPPGGGRAATDVDWRPLAEDRPWRGWNAVGPGFELCQMLVIRKAAQDGARAQKRDAVARAQERQEHFRIEKSAAVQQRKDKVDVRPVKQSLVAVFDDQIQSKPFEYLAHFAMIGRMIAVLGVQIPGPSRMLCDEHHSKICADIQGNWRRSNRARLNSHVISEPDKCDMTAAVWLRLLSRNCPQAVMPLGYPTPVNGGELLIPALAKTIEPVRRAVCSDLSAAASELMTTGGDQRIVLNQETGLNQYMVAPRPSTMTAYSSSTANDISGPAFSEVTRRLAALAPDLQLSPGAYGDALDGLRQRIRSTWALPATVDIAFAGSGTDLEYVGLVIANRGEAGILNILLGSDEVGSGCAHSARGNFFADCTALGVRTVPGAPVDPAKKDSFVVKDIPIRGAGGFPIPSEDILLSVCVAIEFALLNNEVPLVHVVHGSKTGLILPSFAHIDALRRRFGNKVCFVVDACQARIDRDSIVGYLSRGATVFLTGSKFMGGPPFSGFALIPEKIAQRSSGLFEGFEKIFNRAEWPEGWKNRDMLPHGSNLGLLLRLEASIYELELFNGLSAADVRRTLDHFDDAINCLTKRIGASRLAPNMREEAHEVRQHPLEMRTLVTIDLGQSALAMNLEQSRQLYRSLACESFGGQVSALRPVRLGQPVKYIPNTNGDYCGNLRIGLSMPQMVEFAAMDTHSLKARLQSDMQAIAARIEMFVGARHALPTRIAGTV